MSTEPHDASTITGSMDVIGGSASGAGGIDYQVKYSLCGDRGGWVVRYRHVCLFSESSAF